MKEEIVKNNSALWRNLSSILYLLLVVSAAYWLNLEHKLNKEVSWFEFVLLALANFRLIRLFTYDVVTAHIRNYLGKFDLGYRKELAVLINCPWCTGVWMGLFVTFIFFLHPVFHFFILALAIAGLGTFIQILIWKIGLEPGENNK